MQNESNSAIIIDMKKLFKLITFTVPLTPLFLTSCATTKQSDNSKKINKVLCTGELITIKETKDYLVTDIEYYKYPENYSLVNAHITSVVTGQYTEFKSYAKEEWTHATLLNDTTLPPYQYNVKTTDYEDNSIISVLVNSYIYDGGPHGNYNLVSFNYDKKNKKLFTLEDLCKYSINDLSDLCRANLVKQIIDYKKMKIPEINELTEYIYKGTEPNKGNFEVYTVDSKNIYFYFEPYSVAPYSFGTLIVKLSR